MIAELLIGRKQEQRQLKEYLNSDRSEFIAVYGRRRVGKTFLIRSVANDDFSFFMTGVHEVSKSEQLLNFSIALQNYSGSETVTVYKNWLLAFHALSTYLERLKDGKKKVVFIDELPWMDTPRSGFIPALENFWNSWAALRNDVKLIVCGSATSWMINNLIRNRGGLHNRLTHHIVLQPFTLGECEQYFSAHHFGYTQKQIAECYMVLGGIPYYLSLMSPAKSVSQNVDAMFFGSQAELSDEFDNLYRALFSKPALYISVVTMLATKGIGMTRQELLKHTGMTNNGAFSTVLEELEQCGFIRSYLPFDETTMSVRQTSKTIYQLIDFYTLFYFKFIRANKYQNPHFWSDSVNSPLYYTWAGLSFELLCLTHIENIKHALGISGVQTRVCAWRDTSEEENTQIDLLIDRKDETVNLCEMKYSKEEYSITKEYCERLQHKVDAFRERTETRKSILLTMVTTYGIKPNTYSDIVQCEVTLKDLFEL